MTITRTLERLERFGDSEADRALRPPATGPGRPSGSGDDPSGSGDDPSAPGTPAPRRSWRRRLLIAVAVVLVVGVAVTYLVGFSPLLGASTVQVEGTTTLSADAVRAAAAVADGSPLVRLDTVAVARRVEALPEVASADVAVSYPSTVTVTVVERAPVLRLGDPTRLVDGGGLAYSTLPPGASVPEGLPLTAVDGAELPVAAAVAAAIPAAARALVGRIAVDPPDAAGALPTATLTLVDGRSVLWGDTGRSEEKGGVLAALIGPGAAPIDDGTLDLRDPDFVIVR